MGAAGVPSVDEFNPEQDAKDLKKALDGWSTNKTGVIEVIAFRTAHQLTHIKLAYKELFNEDLVKRLQTELAEDVVFERAVYRWMHPPYEREAILAKVGVKEGDHRVVVETACIYSTVELLFIKKTYHAIHGRSIEDDVSWNTSGDVRKLLLTLLNSEPLVNHSTVLPPETLRDAKRQKVSNPDDASAEYTAGLRTAIDCVVSHTKYLEKLLRHATSKPGHDDALTRVFVTRAEKDLHEVRALYDQSNDPPLHQAVSNVTTGHHKKFMLALLGNFSSP